MTSLEKRVEIDGRAPYTTVWLNSIFDLLATIMLRRVGRKCRRCTLWNSQNKQNRKGPVRRVGNIKILFMHEHTDVEFTLYMPSSFDSI